MILKHKASLTLAGLAMLLAGCSLLELPGVNVHSSAGASTPIAKLVMGQWMNGDKDLAGRVSTLLYEGTRTTASLTRADVEGLGARCPNDARLRCTFTTHFHMTFFGLPKENASKRESDFDLSIVIDIGKAPAVVTVFRTPEVFGGPPPRTP